MAKTLEANSDLTMKQSYRETLARIQAALDASRNLVAQFTPETVYWEYKSLDDPVSELDITLNRMLRDMLVRPGEGWLSEETDDNPDRLLQRRVWIVDPLDGTREFIAGIREWCVSIALVDDREPVAGGICNPGTGECFLGSIDAGVTYNHRPVHASRKATLYGATVLASRTEVQRGEWARFQPTEFNVRPVGSVAYKLALVAAGMADASWTLCPKHEWDVAAGVALVKAAGGTVTLADGTPVSFNSRIPLLPNLVAAGPALHQDVLNLIQRCYPPSTAPTCPIS